MDLNEYKQIQRVLQEVEDEQLVSSEDEDSDLDEMQLPDHQSKSEQSDE